MENERNQKIRQSKKENLNKNRIERHLMIPIILCGGSGTRLWPLINQKVFYKFINNQSLLEITLDRLKKFKPLFIVSVEEQKEHLEKNFQNYKSAQIIYEPFAKNTAVSIALACFLLKEKRNDIVGIFPADHYIDKKSKFQNLLAQGTKTAKKENKIVTFGIPPSHNSSSYGYIKINSKLKKSSAFKATAFIEKPTAIQAKALINRGSLWNSGIFISPINLLIHYFEKHLPHLWNKIIGIKDQNIYCSCLNFESICASSLQKMELPRKRKSSKEISKFKHNQIHSIYKNLKPVSFDKGIMENIKDYLCIPCDVGWTDLGSWEKIAEWNQKFSGKLNNKAKITEKTSQGNFVFSSEEKHFGLVGIKNQLIVNGSGGFLIANKKELKNIDSISPELDKKKQAEWIKKPWGAYRVLMEKEFFKYKELKVNPKSQLSYQSHKKRAEHWIVMKGSAEVVIEGKTKKLSANEHIFIDQGVRHRLKNPTSRPLLVLEIQIGHCLEDDIIRYKDDYGRI